MYKKPIIVTFTIAALTLASALVWATDRKVLPGAACQPVNETVPISRNAASGKMFNEASATKTWICPVVRDRAYDSVAEGTVRAVDNHYYEDVRCRLHSRNPANTSGQTSAWQSTSGSNSSPQALTFGGLAVPDLGSLLYQCEVPGIYDSTNKSGISSYIVGEAE